MDFEMMNRNNCFIDSSRGGRHIASNGVSLKTRIGPRQSNWTFSCKWATTKNVHLLNQFIDQFSWVFVFPFWPKCPPVILLPSFVPSNSLSWFALWHQVGGAWKEVSEAIEVKLDEASRAMANGWMFYENANSMLN